MLKDLGLLTNREKTFVEKIRVASRGQILSDLAQIIPTSTAFLEGSSLSLLRIGR